MKQETNQSIDSIVNNEQSHDLFDTLLKGIQLPKQAEQPTNSIRDLVDQFLESIKNNNQIIYGEDNQLQFTPNKQPLQIPPHQIELYQKSLNKNCIIYLQPQLERAQITIQLMCYYLKQKKQKKIVFLHNSANQALQKYNQIKEFFPILPDQLIPNEKSIQIENILQVIDNSKYLDNWNVQMWELIFEENQVFCMTSLIFLQILRRGLIQLNQFSLMVIEGCETTWSDKPNNLIIKEFYFELQKNQLETPQIIGETANPIVNIKSIQKVQILDDLLTLAANLDSIYIYSQCYIAQNEPLTEQIKIARDIIVDFACPDREERFVLAMKKYQKKNQDIGYQMFQIQETGACINTNWSCELIEKICTGNQNQNPKYLTYELVDQNNESKQIFVSVLYLPFLQGTCLFLGQQCKSIKEAKSNVAFTVAKNLYEQNYLDCHLDVINTTQIGFHIGADEDDSNIRMSKNQLSISLRFSKKLLKHISFSKNEREFCTFQRYYLQFSKDYFITSKLQTEFYQMNIKYKEQSIMLFYSERFKDIIKENEQYLKLNKIHIFDEQEITYDEYEKAYQIYKEQIIQEQMLLQINKNEYQIKEKKEIFKFVQIELESLLFMIIPKNSSITINEIWLTLLYTLKVQGFQKEIQNWNLRNKQSKANQLNDVQQDNYLLDNIQTLYTNFYVYKIGMFQKVDQPREFKSYFISPQIQLTYTPFQNILLYILNQSLNINNYNFDNLLTGESYYKYLISLQLFYNYINHDNKLIRYLQKQFKSSTYIRNQLLETNIFYYIHNNNMQQCQIIVGLRQQQNEKQSLDESRVHISNYEFAQFVYYSLYLVSQIDYSNSQGLQWLEYINITKQLTYILQNPSQLKQYIPPEHQSNELIERLKINYSYLENIIQYKFNNFELLFRAMTDISYKTIIQKKVQSKFINKLNTKDDLLIQINENQLEAQLKEILQSNCTNQNAYDNLKYNYIGKYIWEYMIVLILAQIQQVDSIYKVVLKSILCNTRFIAYIVVKLSLYKFLNSALDKQIEFVVTAIENNSINSISYQIQQLDVTENTKVLAQCFYALIFAIHLDSNCDIQLIRQVTVSILDKIQCQQLFTQEYINNQNRYKFLKWYQNTFGDFQYLKLIKIPQLKGSNQKKLYLPFNTKTSEIVNLKQEKFYDISQLHIYEVSKQKAWEKLATTFVKD